MEQGFAIVLVAGLTVFGLMFIGMEADLGWSEEEPEDEIIMLDKNMGTIGEVSEDFRTAMDPVTFTVGEGRSDIQAYRNDEARISNGRIFNNPLNFEYEASQPQDGEIEFRVIGREGEGAVYFKANGEKLFEEQMVSDFSGEGHTVEIDQTDLGPGENRFELGTTKGGILSSTEYLLNDIQLEIDDRAYHERRETFRMYQHEFDNFRGAELDFYIPVDASIPSAPLEIRVNGNTVSEQIRGTGEYQVELTTENADLRPGQNTVHFRTSGQVGEMYDIEDANIEVGYAVTSDPEAKSERINLTENELNFINREDTEETLRFHYVNLNNPNELEINLNDETFALEPRNGETSIDLDDEVFEEENILTVSSQGSFRMENLHLSSRVSE